MKRKSIGVIVFVAVFLSVLAALAMAAQDKYTVKVPGGLCSLPPVTAPRTAALRKSTHFKSKMR